MREQDIQRPLCRLLFALFLPKQEKGKNNLSKINDHLLYQNSSLTVRLAMKKPTKSANSAAGMVYRVLEIPAAPK